MADIFVSYAREDRDAIRTLAALLTRTGWTVWWDRHILAGKDFDDVLQAELEVADIARGALATGTTMTTLLVAVADGALKVVDQKEMVRTSRQ